MSTPERQQDPGEYGYGGTNQDVDEVQPGQAQQRRPEHEDVEEKREREDVIDPLHDAGA